MCRTVLSGMLPLVMTGLARAALQAGLAVNSAGRPASSWRDAPIISAVGARAGGLPQTPEAWSHNGQETCSSLRSIDGIMYTVRVGVGTPEQGLDVVVDTGSDLLVVESCQCMDQGRCDPANKCFKEAMSSTLLIKKDHERPATAVLKFESGSIATQVASDTVRIGNARATMDRGVHLMVDLVLDFQNHFEGILGLGLPNSTNDPLALRISARKGFFDNYIPDEKSFPTAIRMGIGHNEEPLVTVRTPTDMHNVSRDRASELDGAGPHESAAPASPSGEPLPRFGFLGQAGISCFSLCFSDSTEQGPDASSGALTFNPPGGSKPLKSIGTMHWGLDFQGVSVGDSAKKLEFCSEEGLEPPRTACSAIPDSGTTYIMGPQHQINVLFEAICDHWPRCTSNHTKRFAAAAIGKKDPSILAYTSNRQDIHSVSKADAFRMLLQDCNMWMKEPLLMDELPPIYFHVADETGLTQALKLSASLYTVSSKEPETQQVVEDIPGLGRTVLGWRETRRMVWMCKAAFAELDYPTAHNGPAWILGVPIFHQHTVGFDRAAVPPTISFSEGRCGGCDDGMALLEGQHHAWAHAGRRPAPRPRRIQGKPRLPKFDATHPF